MLMTKLAKAGWGLGACLLLGVGLAGCGGGGGSDSLSVSPPQGVALAPNSNALGMTKRALDLGIEGDGLLMLQASDDGPRSYTRLGQLDVDHHGHLIHSDGLRVVGVADADAPVAVQALGPLPVLPVRMAPKATGLVEIEMNLDSRLPISEMDDGSFDPRNATTYNKATTLTTYTAAGEAVPLTFFFARAQGLPGTCGDRWILRMTVSGRLMPTEQLCFNDDGLLDSRHGPNLTLAAADSGLSQDLILDFSGSTQFGSVFSVTKARQDGYRTGQLTDVAVTADGRVTLNYDNFQTRSGGRVALARFTVADRLLRPEGSSTRWLCLGGCATPAVGLPGTGLLGTLRPGSLNTVY